MPRGGGKSPPHARGISTGPRQSSLTSAAHFAQSRNTVAVSSALLLLLLPLTMLGGVVFAPTGALAQTTGGGGLAGETCDDDSHCMSRACVGEVCTATTCGLPPSQGGVGPDMPTSPNYCTTFGSYYNPDRVCVFGFGQCTRAECCDTMSCAAGVLDADKLNYCGAGASFADTRLCPGGTCSPETCCVRTKCDGAGGVDVAQRATFCPDSEVFSNVGDCAGGQGACTPDECCVLDTRMCSSATSVVCPPGSTLVGSRLYNLALSDGGCCETTTCETGVPDSDKSAFCASVPQTVFSATRTCVGVICTASDCCRSIQGYCDSKGPGATWSPAEAACTCPVISGKEYLIGFGCACAPGTGLPNAGAQSCEPCPYGTYSASLTAAQTCAACPDNQPYTEQVGSSSADSCINYCDQQALAGNFICSNGGTCNSRSGDPNDGGSFACSCPAAWMGYADANKGKTTTDNCDAPTTLLRLRVLAATNVGSFPSGLVLRVSDTPKGSTPAYALQAPSSLACTVSGLVSGAPAVVPTCNAGGSGALSAAAGTAADTRKFVGTKVKLSTNYDAIKSSLPSGPLAIEWACSDGSIAAAGELDVVLPGPDNLSNAQTLVCTAIIRKAESTGPSIKLKLAAGSVVPEPASSSGGVLDAADISPAQLTFVRGPGGALCFLPVGAVDGADEPHTAPECPASAAGASLSANSGTLGVANIDMDRYTVVWKCGGSTLISAAGQSPGEATTPDLPSAGEPALLCEANFQPKATKLELTVSTAGGVALANAVRVTARQPGMGPSDPCSATIAANTQADADLTLTCPGKSLASGVATTFATDADLNTHLVAFSCVPSTSAAAANVAPIVARKTITVDSTQDGASDVTRCTLTLSELPPLLRATIVGGSGVGLGDAARFQVFASQDATNTCVVSFDPTKASSVDCPLKEGMLPRLETTLRPGTPLDADKYTIGWVCQGAAAFSPFVSNSPNTAKVRLNANPNDGGQMVECAGTVSVRSSPVQVGLVTGLNNLPSNVELRVRQTHQSAPCTIPISILLGEFREPTCGNEGLRTDTRTTLSTYYLDLSTYKVTWTCAIDGAALAVTRVAAGVATVMASLSPGQTLRCSATIVAKPPLLTLRFTGGTWPPRAWTLNARQSTQGRACVVDGVINGTQTWTATVPTCPLQPLLPARSTVLATTGVDAVWWAVSWSCVGGPSGTAAVALKDTKSLAGAVVENSKTIDKLDKDPNLGGHTIACTAALTPRVGVLRLLATGDGLSSVDYLILTAQQPKQSTACTVYFNSGSMGYLFCPPPVQGIEAGASVDLGIQPQPWQTSILSSKVTWTCVATPTSGGASPYPVSVRAGNDGKAMVDRLPRGATTVCTATLSAPAGGAGAVLRIVGAPGLTFTAAQSSSTVCATNGGSSETETLCTAARVKASTMLRADGASLTSRGVRFTCELTTAVSVPVRALTATTAVVTTPPAGESMVCRVVALSESAVLTLTSNRPTVLKAEHVQTDGGGAGAATATCAASTQSNRLACDAGDSPGQLPRGLRVTLSHAGLDKPGFYRWACSSSAAEIQTSESTGADATATVILPPAPGSIACSLTYSSQQPNNGRRRLFF